MRGMHGFMGRAVGGSMKNIAIGTGIGFGGGFLQSSIGTPGYGVMNENWDRLTEYGLSPAYAGLMGTRMGGAKVGLGAGLGAFAGAAVARRMTGGGLLF